MYCVLILLYWSLPGSNREDDLADTWAPRARHFTQPASTRSKGLRGRAMHREQVRQSPWIQCDDTTMEAQYPSLAPEIRTGHLWVYRGELGEVVYDFTWSRNRDGPLKMRANYRGSLQVDAAPAHDDVFAQYPGIVEVGCMAHARRYFKEALPTAAVPCAQALAIIKQLSGIERAASNRQLDATARQGLRQEKPADPGETTCVSAAAAGGGLPKSPLGAAVGSRWATGSP